MAFDTFAYQATKVIPTTPIPLSHIAGRQQWTEDEADGDKGESPPPPGSLPKCSIISLLSLFIPSSDILLFVYRYPRLSDDRDHLYSLPPPGLFQVEAILELVVPQGR